MTTKKKQPATPPPVWIHETPAPTKIIYSKAKHTPDGMCVENEYLEVQDENSKKAEAIFDRKKKGMIK